MATSKKDPIPKPQMPNNDGKSFIGKGNKRLAGFDLINDVIANNKNPYEAVSGAGGIKSSAYSRLKDALGDKDAQMLFTAAHLFNNTPQYQNLSKEERINRFYGNVSASPQLQHLKDEVKGYMGRGSAQSVYQSSPIFGEPTPPTPTPLTTGQRNDWNKFLEFSKGKSGQAADLIKAYKKHNPESQLDDNTPATVQYEHQQMRAGNFPGLTPEQFKRIKDRYPVSYWSKPVGNVMGLYYPEIKRTDLTGTKDYRTDLEGYLKGSR